MTNTAAGRAEDWMRSLAGGTPGNVMPLCSLPACPPSVITDAEDEGPLNWPGRPSNPRGIAARAGRPDTMIRLTPRISSRVMCPDVTLLTATRRVR